VTLLTHALPGFRTWMLDAKGTLIPYTGQVGPWTPGVNTAQCSRGAAHTAPAEDCSCGIYAFHHLHGQLRAEAFLGAIAAWGDMDVYRDGFRAQHATVLALAGRRSPALSRAAERYGVPIVPRAALQPLGQLLTGALPATLVDDGGPDWLARRRGFDDQVWVEPAGGQVTLGISAPLREWLGPGLEVEVRAREDRRVAMRLRGERGEVNLPALVRGSVQSVNAAPAAVAADPEGGCWLARVAPTDWEEDCRQFRWGAAARRAMLIESWEHLTEGDGAISSWRDVKAMLAEMRAAPPPRFATPEQLYDEIAIPLGQALGRDRSLTRLDLVLAFETTDPEARLLLDLRRDHGTLHTTRGPVPDVEVALKADDLVDTLLGKVDLARESRTGRLRVRGSLAHALSGLAIVSAWARPHLTAGVTPVLSG
jgi:glycine cleavage system H lipoate-binding protein